MEVVVVEVTGPWTEIRKESKVQTEVRKLVREKEGGEKEKGANGKKEKRN